MEIKVMGSGCASCKKLLERTRAAVDELGIDAEILYVTDYALIAEAGVLRTPGLLVDGRIVSSGRVLDVSEIKALIHNV